MKRTYEDVTEFNRLGIIDVVMAIIALPVFTSVVSSI